MDSNHQRELGSCDNMDNEALLNKTSRINAETVKEKLIKKSSIFLRVLIFIFLIAAVPLAMKIDYDMRVKEYSEAALREQIQTDENNSADMLIQNFGESEKYLLYVKNEAVENWFNIHE